MRLPTLLPRDRRERAVIEMWRAIGLKEGTIGVYLHSVRRFRAHWRMCGIDEVERLTRADVVTYAKLDVGPRCGRVSEANRHAACTAMHAWSCALELGGVRVPSWRSPSPPRRWPTLVDEYGEYRRSHRGVAEKTLVRDRDVALRFLKFLQSRGRRVGATRVADLDDFVDGMSRRRARRTVARDCSSLRSFLRYLRTKGRIRHDLASCIIAPRFRTDERPPRALEWESVRRILRAIPRDRPIARRDYAMFLLMAAYGLGAGEIITLRLGDVDWRNGILRVCRPKTGVPIELPLLPAVARALATYLRRGRPRTTRAREIFVTARLPHRSITTSVLRHQVRIYAAQAGVVATMLGSHVFRHSHATRQIDAGAPVKIVGDILGHRRPSSTSAYVRLALRRLRAVGLPVPR